MPVKNIPFFSNTPDGTHCFQAALRIIFAHFWPHREFTHEELDIITAKLPGKWTWPTAGMIWMMEQGFELQLIEDFDYKAFARRGEKYIFERCGPEVGAAQIENSVISREIKFARKFAEMAPLESRIPSFDDIKKFLDQGFLLICNINAAALYNQPGYSGHFVVVFDSDNDSVTIHDPGLPARASLKVMHDQFERAWAYPADRDKNLLAVRLKN